MIALAKDARSDKRGVDDLPLLDPASEDYSYHDDHGRVSSSMLKMFLGRRQMFGEVYVKKSIPPKASTPCMDMGSVVHAVFLERKKLLDLVKPYEKSCLKSNGHLNPDPAKRFRQKNSEYRWFMKWNDVTRARDLCEALQMHKCYRWLSFEGAIRERSIFWDCPFTKMPCRAQPDFLIELQDRVLFFDLKVTVNFNETAFASYLAGNKRGAMRGWVQEAHYRRGIEEIYGKPADLFYIAINPEPPHEIFVHKIARSTIEDTQLQYERTMESLHKCYQEDDWLEDAQKDDNPITLNAWEIC